jgi:hypothetical protein
MTTFVAMLGLTPAALSHGIGADTQKPLAIVVIGGALILALIPRLIQPPLLVLAHKRERRWKNRPPTGGPPPVEPGRPSSPMPAFDSGVTRG